MNKHLLCTCILLCGLTACHRVPDQIEPTLNCVVEDRYLHTLPSPFHPLTEEERSQDWGKEMWLAQRFAQQLDLYQSIICFKRAEMLIPPEEKGRLLEIQYEILYSYYIAHKWTDVIYTFEHSALKHADISFPALRDMLIIMYDAYYHEQDERQTHRMLQLIQCFFPEEAQKIYLSNALVSGDIARIETVDPRPGYLNNFLTTYTLEKKSVGKAQALNAVLPGAGYYYLGQKQSAITAFLLNGLFIGASTYFFIDGNIPAGIIFTSFEAGWYFGGIYGGGLEAKYYNERLYERLTTPMMNQEGLFPVLMLNYAF